MCAWVRLTTSSLCQKESLQHTHTQRDWLTDARNPVSLFRMIRSFTITWMFATVDIYLILSIRSLTCQMTWPVLSSHNRHLLVSLSLSLSLSLCLSVCASLVIWQQNVKKWNWRLLGSKVQPFLSSSRTCVSKKETLVWRWVNDCFPCLLGFSLSLSLPLLSLSLLLLASFPHTQRENVCGSPFLALLFRINILPVTSSSYVKEPNATFRISIFLFKLTTENRDLINRPVMWSQNENAMQCCHR
jgi:hypothetical protein